MGRSEILLKIGCFQTTMGFVHTPFIRTTQDSIRYKSSIEIRVELKKRIDHIIDYTYVRVNYIIIYCTLHTFSF